MLEILEIKKITWKTPPIKPRDFPCMICCKKIGMYRMKGMVGMAHIGLCLCWDCAWLSAAEISDALAPKE